MVIDIGKLFILPCLFFSCCSKRKQAIESRFRNWRCVRIMQTRLRILQASVFLDVHQAQEFYFLFGSTLLQLLFAGFILLWRNRKFPHELPGAVRTKGPRDPHYPAPARSRVPPFKQIQNRNLASTAPMSRVKGQFLDQNMLLVYGSHAMPCHIRAEQSSCLDGVK